MQLLPVPSSISSSGYLSSIGPVPVEELLDLRQSSSVREFVETYASALNRCVLVLDEAHKYLTDSGSPSRLTESLLSLIRQQRHENMRVLISTQEPTVVPSKFLDLCSFIIAHRFSSRGWLKHLAKHVSAADALTDFWASKVRPLCALRYGAT
jgi:hypothetical protein